MEDIIRALRREFDASAATFTVNKEWTEDFGHWVISELLLPGSLSH